MSGEALWNRIIALPISGQEILTGSYNCRSGAKSFANVVIRDTGLSASDILEMLDNKGI